MMTIAVKGVQAAVVTLTKKGEITLRYIILDNSETWAYLDAMEAHGWKWEARAAKVIEAGEIDSIMPEPLPTTKEMF